MSSVLLQQLLARRDTWRGRDADSTCQGATTTGFRSLDQILGGNGWPHQGLVEWLCPLPCPSLLHLLLPLLTADTTGARLIANPPARPSATALAAAGASLKRVLVLQSPDRQALLSACLEAVTSETLSLLALWSPAGPLPAGTLRRLHLGARQGRCLLILMRPLHAARRPSPAPLRLRFACPAPGELDLIVHKQPGHRPGQYCRLTLLPEHLRHPPPSCAELDAPMPRAAVLSPGQALPPRPTTMPAATSASGAFP